MTLQPAASQTHATTPVVLANRSMKALWPWSVPGCPYPFQSAGGSDAPVVALLRGLDANPGFARPILVIAPDMLQSALGALGRGDCPMPTIMTVPAGAQGGIAAALAALETACEARRTPLAFLPAAFGTSAPLGEYLHHVVATMTPAALSGFAVMAARRGIDPLGGTALIAGTAKPGTGLLETARCLAVEARGEPGSADISDTTEAANDQGAVWTPTGPVVVIAGRVLDMIHEVDPMLLQACRNALQRAERRGNVIHPEQNFLSLVRDQLVGRVLANNARSILIDPGGGAVTPVRSWADVPADAPVRLQQPARPVHGAGMPDCALISGPGGLLALVPGHEDEVARYFGRAAPVHEVAPAQERKPEARQRAWGSQEVVDMRVGVAVLRLTVQPGGMVEPECHVHRSESWVIAGGKARVTLGAETRDALAGDHIAIPRGTVHALENSGSEPLIVYETRTGALTGEDDRIAPAPSLRAI